MALQIEVIHNFKEKLPLWLLHRLHQSESVRRPNMKPKTIFQKIKVGAVRYRGKGKVCIQAKWLIRPELISGFCSMKPLGVFLLPPGWDAGPSQGYPPAQHWLNLSTAFSWVFHWALDVRNNNLSAGAPMQPWLEKNKPRALYTENTYKSTYEPSGPSYQAWV